jgi:hypothetical protein
MEELMEIYRQRGAPHGDSMDGLIRYLIEIGEPIARERFEVRITDGGRVELIPRRKDEIA